MVKDFQPFYDLWTTASDWLRWADSWMNDPLSAIDAEQLEKNVNESFKTMHKCVKQFKDIPGSYRALKCHFKKKQTDSEMGSTEINIGEMRNGEKSKLTDLASLATISEIVKI